MDMIRQQHPELSRYEQEALAEYQAKVEDWQSRDINLVLPEELGRAMWDHAQSFGMGNGGRFDTESASYWQRDGLEDTYEGDDRVEIWSNSAGADAEPTGVFYFDWDTPGSGQVTIYQIAWDPTEGGSEAEVWIAMELLAGQSLR